MTKPLRSLALSLTLFIALPIGVLGYKTFSNIPDSDSSQGILESPFQTAFIQKDNVQGDYPENAKAEDIEKWSHYTGGLKNDVLYYIFVDRFFDGDLNNNQPQVNPASNGSEKQTALEQKLSDISYDSNHRLFGLYFGGDLEGVRKKLAYLADLGVTKIVLSPIQEGAPGFRTRKGANLYLDNGDGSQDKTGRHNLLANYHGYWIRDWFRIDPRFRSVDNPDSLSDLSQLLDEAKKHNIGVILDLTLHHTSLVASRQSVQASSNLVNIFPALGEVRRKGMILANINTNPGWYYKPCSMDYARPSVQMLTTCQIDVGLPTLNHDNPIVEKYLLEAAEYWLKVNPGGAQIAGIRIDAIKHINSKFIKKLVDLVHSIRPDSVIFAEDFGGGSQTTSTYQILNESGNISTIDFSFTNSIRHYFSGDRSWTGQRSNLEASSLGDIRTSDLSSITPDWFSNPARILASKQNSDPLFPSNYPASKSWITSLETHDAPKLRTFRHQMSDQEYASMIAFHFVARGVPLINYGAEIGLSVPPLPRNNGLNGLGGDPFNRQMMVWPGQQGFNNYLYKTTKQMIRLRKDNPVLRYGDTFFLRPTTDLWVARPLLMLRAFKSEAQKPNSSPAFIYSFSPEGGIFSFTLPDSIHQPSRVCEIDTGLCKNQFDKEVKVSLKPNQYKLLKLEF